MKKIYLVIILLLLSGIFIYSKNTSAYESYTYNINPGESIEINNSSEESSYIYIFGKYEAVFYYNESARTYIHDDSSFDSLVLIPGGRGLIKNNDDKILEIRADFVDINPVPYKGSVLYKKWVNPGESVMITSLEDNNITFYPINNRVVYDYVDYSQNMDGRDEAFGLYLYDSNKSSNLQVNNGRYVITNRDTKGYYISCPSENCTFKSNEKPAFSSLILQPNESAIVYSKNTEVYSNINWKFHDSQITGETNVDFVAFNEEGQLVSIWMDLPRHPVYLRSYSYKNIITNINENPIVVYGPEEIFSIESHPDPALMKYEVLPGKSIRFSAVPVYFKGNFDFAAYDEDNLSIAVNNFDHFNYSVLSPGAYARTFSNGQFYDRVMNWGVLQNVGDSPSIVYGPYGLFIPRREFNPAIKYISVDKGQFVEINNPLKEFIGQKGGFVEYRYDEKTGEYKYYGPPEYRYDPMLLKASGSTQLFWGYYASINGSENSGGSLPITGKDGTENQRRIDPDNINECSLISDPIDASTGAQIIDKFYLTINCSVPMQLHLQYNSLLLSDGPLGKGWNHNYETKLLIKDPNNIDVQWNVNRFNSFILSDNNIFKSSDLSTITDLIIRNSDGSYSLKRKDHSVYLFNSQGQLLKITYPNGHALDLQYGINGQLSSIMEPLSGQTFIFNYDSMGKISEVSDIANRKVSFIYDSNGSLMEISNENNEKTSYTYSSNGALLTGKDHNGNLIFSNSYDNLGRVKEQADAEGYTTSFDYYEQDAKVITAITKRDGGKRVLTHNRNYQLIEVEDELGNVTTFTYDSRGNQTSITNANGHTTSMSYDDRGNIILIRNAEGHETSMSYDERNNLISKTNALGQMTTYSYNEKNSLLSMTNPLGYTTRWAYNTDGLLESKTEPDETTTRYSYSLGRLSSITDPSGAVTSYEYDIVGRLIKIIDAEGNISKLEYDSRTNVARLVDSKGYITKFSYDSLGNVTTVTDAEGNLTSYNYNGNNQRISLIDALHQETRYEYDPEDRLNLITDPLGQNTVYRYDLSGRITSTTDAKGNTVELKYDRLGQLIQRTSVSGYKVTYEYDKVGNLVREIDEEGNATVRNYDAIGQLISIIDPLGRTTSYTYDANGNLNIFEDPMGQKTRFTYSPTDKLIKQTDALGNETKFEYDPNGKLTKTIDALGNSVTYTYNLLGNLIRITDSSGHSSTLSYDSNGNLVSETDAKGKKLFETSYDSLSRPVQIVDILGNNTKNNYDALGRLTATTDPLGKQTLYNYDQLNRLVSVIDPSGLTSNQSFDANNLVTSIIDPISNEQNFSYDKQGNLLEESNGTDASINYEYNKKGLLIKQINARGQSTLVEYDPLGRIIKVIYPENEISYSYDKNGNILEVAEGDLSIVREYDSLNRVTSYQDMFGNIIRYSYDKVGNLTKLTYPDGKTVSYSYNKNGMLESVTDWQGRTTTYQYDENSRLITTTRPNRTVETRSYDDKGQLIELKDLSNDGSIIVHDHFTYDAVGLVETEHRINSVGSISSEDLVSMTYGADNRLETYNGEIVSFDADGNMTVGPLQGSIYEFQYDSRNRLVHAGGLSYTYDSANQRVSVTDGNETTRLIVNPEAFYSQVLMETDENGNVMAYYVYGLGLISREDAEGNIQTYHYDRRGSTVALTDQQGSITDQYTYDTYGELIYQEGDTENPFLYSGKYGVMTDDNGLYYMRARYYNPEIKRFINRDVILGNVSDGQSLNRYAYVNGNPVSYIDPFGLSRDSDSYDYFIENTIIALAESVYHDTIGTFEAIINYEDTIKGIEQNIKNFSLENTIQSLGQYVVEFACADSERQAEMTGQLLSGFVGGPINKVNRFVPKRFGHLDAPMAGDNIGSMLRIDGMQKATQRPGSLVLDLQLFGGGRGKNNLKPDPTATGDHTVFKRDPATSNITNYETYKTQTNPKNPNPFEFVKRYDGVGGSHYDKATGLDVPTPHVHESINPGGARPPFFYEIPKRR